MCDRCGRSFTYESDLRNHMYSSHSRRRTPLHSCTWCHRQFSSTSHLASHERTHTGDRPYTCDTCGKQFTQSGSLNVHRRTHVEPQPFACDICGQRFASKQYAKKHLAMRHGAAKSATNAS
jgi:KRAB domain-containing zinc finger protein